MDFLSFFRRDAKSITSRNRFTPTTKEELEEACINVLRNNTTQYGNSDEWDVSRITDMSELFKGKLFNNNLNIQNWNVSNVTNMAYMFESAIDFNQDIGNWDVSNVTDMTGMFYDSKYFNQDIGKWDVSKVDNMMFMFYNATNFNQDIGKWDVSKVNYMNHMFKATTFNQDIGNWNVVEVETMEGMFSEATNFNQDIGRWDVSNVENMIYMFHNATNFNQDIGNWDVSKVENMRGMFDNAISFNQDIGRWNVNNVIEGNRNHEHIQQVTGDGVAYQIHNFFDDNKTMLKQVSTTLHTYYQDNQSNLSFRNISSYTDPSTLDELLSFSINDNIPNNELNWKKIHDILELILTNISSFNLIGDSSFNVIQEDIVTELLTRIDQLVYFNKDAFLFKLTCRSLLFMCSDIFTAETQVGYFKSFIYSCGTAYDYNPHRPSTNSISCPTGIIERITLNMLEIVKNVCYNTNNHECPSSGIVNKIFKITESVLDPNDMKINDWLTTEKCNQVYDLKKEGMSNEEYNNAVIELYKQNNLPDGRDINSYYRDIPSNILNYIPEYAFDHCGTTGGTRKRVYRKKVNKSRKTKKNKNKQKIKTRKRNKKNKNTKKMNKKIKKKT